MSILDTIVGWRLNERSARDTAVRSHQWSTAARLAHEVTAAVEGCRSNGISQESLIAGRGRLQSAGELLRVIDHPEISERFRSLDQSMFVGLNHASIPEVGINFWPILIASDELLTALANYQLGREIPPALFPRAEEVTQLAHPDGRAVGLDGVRDLLVQRGAG